MKLEITSVQVEELAFTGRTGLVDHRLEIDKSELAALLCADERIADVTIELVHPGENTRIVNVVDVIQPRCRLTAAGIDFPGWLDTMDTVGHGRTLSLAGVTVVLCNPHSKRSYASLIDTFGPGARIGRYGTLRHVCIAPHPADNVDERDFEDAVKTAGLKAAVYLAGAARRHPADDTEVYQLDVAGGRRSSLPRVAYYYQLHTPQHDYQGKPDPIFYGTTVTELFPTIVHPNEVLDGAIVSPHTIRCLDTYSIQNHAVIKELYRRHQVDLEFAGVIVGMASLEHFQRKRMASMAAKLGSSVLDADGVILTKAFGGMPHVDLGLTAEAFEKVGIKTTLFIMLVHSRNTIADEAYFDMQTLNSIVNVGQVAERFQLPGADRIVGGTGDTPISNPDCHQTAGDPQLDVESFLLAGAIDMLGDSRTIAADY